MNVPQSTTTLVITAVGFAEQEVNVTNSATVDITLWESTGNLNEVVVVGYGGVRRRDLTGSVASVQAKDFNTGQINSPEQLLQGKVAGLQITNSSGQQMAADHVLNFRFLLGDADGNGVIDFDDFARIDNGFNQGLTGRRCSPASSSEAASRSSIQPITGQR